jgi:hypothetical protein
MIPALLSQAINMQEVPGLLGQVLKEIKTPAQTQGQGMGVFRQDPQQYDKQNPTPAPAPVTQEPAGPGGLTAKALQEELAGLKGETSTIINALLNLPGVSSQATNALQDSYKPQAPPQFAGRNDLLALLPLLFAPDRQSAAAYSGGIAAGLQGRYGERQAQQLRDQQMSQQAAQQRVANEEREIARRRGDLQIQLGGIQSNADFMQKSYEIGQNAFDRGQTRDLTRAQIANQQLVNEFNQDQKTQNSTLAAQLGLGNVAFSRGNALDESYTSVAQRAKAHNDVLLKNNHPDARNPEQLKKLVDDVMTSTAKSLFFRDYSKATNVKARPAQIQVAIDRLTANNELPDSVKKELQQFAYNVLKSDVLTPAIERAERRIRELKGDILAKYGEKGASTKIDDLVQRIAESKGRDKRAKQELEEKAGQEISSKLISLIGTLQRAKSDFMATKEERQAAGVQFKAAMAMVPGFLKQIGGDFGDEPEAPAKPGPLTNGMQGYSQSGPTFNINLGGLTNTSGVPAAYGANGGNAGGGQPGAGGGKAPAGRLLNGGLKINPDHLDRIVTPPLSTTKLSLYQVQDAFTKIYNKFGPNHENTKRAFRNLRWANNEVQQSKT